jgi:hypothetical protein
VPTIDTKINACLREVVTLAARGLPVSWPKETFTPPKTATGLLPFLSVGITKTATRAQVASDAPQERTGILTLVYCAPLGYSSEWYVEQASGLLAYFRPNGFASFQGLCIRWGNGLAVPRIDEGYRDDGYIRTPVIIPWRVSREA